LRGKRRLERSLVPPVGASHHAARLRRRGRPIERVTGRPSVQAEQLSDERAEQVAEAIVSEADVPAYSRIDRSEADFGVVHGDLKLRF
jgi:hypothetical protein